MTAHIKLEVEGTGAEVRAALEDLLAPVTHEQTMSEEEYASLKKVVVRPEEIPGLLEKPEVREALRAQCAHCGTDLTSEQVKSGANYCSRKCASLHTSKKMVETRKKNAEAARKAAGKPVAKVQETDRVCAFPGCDKILAKGQAKFCSKAHANKFNMNLRKKAREAKEASTKESHSSGK